jgi:hypothetical protein
MHRPLLAIAVAGAAILAPVAAQAQAPAVPPTAPLTFNELDKGSTFQFHDVAPKAKLSHGFPSTLSAGDSFTFTNPLADASGTRLGTLDGSCVAPASTTKFVVVCTGVFELAGGEIWVGVHGGGSSTTVGAVLGGTGAYAGARGSFTSKEGKTSSLDTFTFLP